MRDSTASWACWAARPSAPSRAEPIKEHLLITRYNPSRVQDGQMLSLEDIQDILRIKLIGVIPESEAVLQSSNQGIRPSMPRAATWPRPTRT